MKKAPKQPSENAERELLDIIEDVDIDVAIGSHTYTIKPIRKGTRIKLTRILLEEFGSSENGGEKTLEEMLSESKMEDKVLAKSAAAIILNSWWKLYFLGGVVWSLYWRWLYYFRQYTDSDYVGIMNICKKKVEKQTTAYTMSIMLLTAMKTTTMSMTRAEVKRSLLESRMEQLGAPQRNSQTSQQADTSSSE